MSRSYDNWKTDADAAPDHGRGGGTVPKRLACRDCAWSVSDTSMVRAVGAAQVHVSKTGHAITYKGVVQQWSHEIPRKRDVA